MLENKTRFAIVVGLVLAPSLLVTAEAVSCKQYSNCAEAVENWCAGKHGGADRDKDGIPCENVCKTNSQVDKIKKKLGCEK